MDKRWNRAGLAAIILLAPGGFILGATLGARYLRKRAADAEPGNVEAGEDQSDNTSKK